jgi:BlaI family transcriptional regulator, penicillinase repressor
MRSKARLGDLQAAIMRVLWTRGEATAADVHEALFAKRGLAPTTIATMLRKMEERGIVGHRVQGRQFVFVPALSETEVRRSMVADIVGRLFEGDHAALVSHLLSEHEISRNELDEIRALLSARRAKQR